MFTVLILISFLLVAWLPEKADNIVYCDRPSTKLNTIPKSLISLVNVFHSKAFLSFQHKKQKHEHVISVWNVIVRVFRSLRLHASINLILRDFLFFGDSGQTEADDKIFDCYGGLKSNTMR